MAYLRERSPCPRSLKFADFTLRTRAKLFLLFKNNLKNADQHKKFTKKPVLVLKIAKNVIFTINLGMPYQE